MYYPLSTKAIVIYVLHVTKATIEQCNGMWDCSSLICTIYRDTKRFYDCHLGMTDFKNYKEKQYEDSNDHPPVWAIESESRIYRCVVTILVVSMNLSTNSVRVTIVL